MTEQIRKRITDILTESISMLFEDTTYCLDNLRKQKFRFEDNQTHFEKWLDYLDCCRGQILIHKTLDNATLINVDFAKEIQQYFIDKKYMKRVAFYVRRGHDGEKEQVKDPDVLSQIFTIPNCLSIMSLVPMQLALNARKYMPIETSLDIEITTTEYRNYLAISNIGPQCDEDEMDVITEEGARGTNTEDYAGMGIGLSEVQTILDIHHDWLETTFDVDSTSEFIMLNGYRHSIFKAEITYLSHPSSDIKPHLDDFKNKIPVILIHNSMDIANSVLDVCDHLLKINEKTNKDWREYAYKLRLSASVLLKKVKECIFMSNGGQIEDIFGLECKHFKMQSSFIAIIKELQKHDFPNISPDINGFLNKKYNNMQTVEGIRTIILSICQLVMSNIHGEATLEVNFEGDQIMLKCDEGAEFTKIIEKTESENAQKLSFNMCQNFIDYFGGTIILSNNKFTILL